jgi:mitogen-activated protein kinase 1/3
LVNANCDLKICDLGLARVIFPDKKSEKTNILTDYVATRWYRPPELLLEAREYETNVDVWSVGCIFAEMIKRKPFLPGGDSHIQLDLICENFGTPSPDDFKHISEGAKKLLINKPKKSGRPLQ